jgi:tRNA-dihydrouridine synthase B
MSPQEHLRRMLQHPEPVLVLAPMQDVTDRAFCALIARYGGADLYVTEYFRVYPGSTLNRRILRSATDNPTGQPALAQLIGNDIPNLVRTARELQRHPVAGIDLNLGCPAPVVYRKCAGGGLLRDLPAVDAILGALRDAVTIPFTVKTRLGFDSPDTFDALLPILAKHSLDLVAVHGRTVKEMYRSAVRYDLIERAVRELPCPVLANGNITSAAKAAAVLRSTGAKGLMIGRGAIRNPWLFRQIRQHLRGEVMFTPTGRDVLTYVQSLHETVCPAGLAERSQVQRLKKFLNYLGLGIEPTGEFLHRTRRVTTLAELFAVCERFLDHDRPMPLEPFPLALKETDVLAGEHR